MSANAWLHDFHECIRKKSAQLSQCELEKGEFEASLLLIGSKVLSSFPKDIAVDESIPTAVIRLLEELEARRKEDGRTADLPNT